MIEPTVPDARELAVLAGAGISLDAPANLLDGGSFMRSVLTRVTPPDVDREWALSVLRLPERRLRRPGEVLRFEVLMHELVQQGLDPGLTVLNCLDECGHPNFNHFVLAELIRSGAIVVTTNFDRLIEIAWERLVGPDGPALAVAAFDRDFPPGLPDGAAPPTLYKIHGSLSVGGRDTRASLQATLAAALSTPMRSRKAAFLAAVLRARDLYVVGYSGWDDLDIVPVLADTHSSRRLVWVDHDADASAARVLNADAAGAATPAKFEVDAVGRDRVWFVTDPSGEPTRDPDRALCVSVRTRVVMERLAASLPSGGRYPVDGTGFAFGAGHPDRVRRYFDEWDRSLRGGDTARYKLVAALHRLSRFLPETAAHLEHVEETVRRLRRQGPPTAEQQLEELIDEHNRIARGADALDRGPLLLELRRRAEALGDGLPPETRGTRLRLLACIAWKLDGPEDGARGFAESAAVFRAAGLPDWELGTLLTWRSHAGMGWWGDNLPHWVSLRIEGIAATIGFLPVVWQQEIMRHEDVIDEDAPLAPVHRRLSRMRRYSVDVGDVRAEALLCVQIGRLFLLDQQPGLAMEEFLRARELCRLLEDERIASDADFFIDGCRARIGPAYEARMLPLIRRSMWAGRDEPAP